MKIEGLFGNKGLTPDAIKQEIRDGYPDIEFSSAQMDAFSRVHVLYRARMLLESEQDDTSKLMVDALNKRLEEVVQEDDNYLSALKRIERPGGMRK